MWDEPAWEKFVAEHKQMVAQFGDPKIQQRADWWEKIMWGKMVKLADSNLME